MELLKNLKEHRGRTELKDIHKGSEENEGVQELYKTEGELIGK